MAEENARLPEWSPRVRRDLIRRLYECDARGICDEELIDEVGFALYARCQSFIMAMEAVNGRVACPSCESTVRHDGKPDTVLHCDACGWELRWRDYFATLQHRQLSGDFRVVAMFADFVARYPAARAPREKMLLIDQLIHSFHEDLRGPRRTTGVNLIAGNYHQVVHFLDELSYGSDSTPGIADVRDEWRRKIEHTAETWGDEHLHLAGKRAQD
ncbi:MAG: hypothetical protein M1434_09925 [Chloroflexi bacterium]|nr:hypothetical protein [Chloroflexota bacterium]